MTYESPIERVLIPINFTDGSRSAFYAGLRIAVANDADVWVLHVAEPIRAFDFGKKRYVETKEAIDRVEAGVRARIDELWAEGGIENVDRRRIHIVVRGGKPAAEIVEAAKDKDADIIVIGASSDGAMGAPLGRVTERVMRDAVCSVYCVRRDRRNRDKPTYE